MITLYKKSVLVLGLGETGLSMVRWLSAQGACVRVADSRFMPPGMDEVRNLVGLEHIFCGPFNDAIFACVDLIAISPGVALADPHVARAVALGIPVVGDIELFAQQLTADELQHAAKVLAITGSNGKTTVTTLVAHLCRACGLDAVAAGNISPAVLDVVLQRGEHQPAIWVLELSSFQLETTLSLKADAATILNISEDHLDRYRGMTDYVEAKKNILSGCRVQVLNRDDARSIGMQNPSRELISFGLDLPVASHDFGILQENNEIWLMQGDQRLLKASELQLAGLHNVANALAALALCSAIDLPVPLLLDALRRFKGLPHRVEKVVQLHGVTFYDDSKGTNVGATVAALQGLGSKAVLIAGGQGKAQDFSPLKSAVTKHARAVVLIGQDAPLIETALQGCNIAINHAVDMQDAVQQAARIALPGDAVLLSPACASLDMYKNYAHRAEVFIKEVGKLEQSWPH